MEFDDLLLAITQATRYREQLVLVTNDAASNLLIQYSQANDIPLINLGAELSAKLLEIPHLEWPKKVAGLFNALVEKNQTSIILLDRIEVLFDRTLAIDPLKLLKSSARNLTVVVVWPSVKSEILLTYAIPNHPEYRAYKQAELKEVAFVNAGELQKEIL